MKSSKSDDSSQFRPDDRNYNVDREQAERAANKFLRDELFYGERTYAYLEERAGRQGVSGPDLRDAARRLGVEITIRDGGEYWFLQGPLNARNPLTEGLAALLDVEPAKDVAPKADRVGGIDPWTIPLPGERIDFDAIRARIGSFKSIVEQEWGVQLKNGRCACQFHDGGNPTSFSVKDGWAKCFSEGCFSGDVFDFIAKCRGISNVEAARELDHLHRANGNPNGGRRIVSVYPYRDHEGQTLYEVVRYDPKEFRQRRPDGTWGLGGIETVLYRLPELIDSDPESPVFVVEGEKDVDRLIQLGLVATCNPMGAGKWQDRYAERFHGRHVVILPDNDETGRNHAAQVARSLHGKVRSVKVLDLPDMPPKGDVSDFLTKGGTKDQLMAIAEKATAWTPPGRRRTANLSDLKRDDRGRFVWPYHLVRAHLNLLSSHPKIGKTHFGLDLARRLWFHEPWPDRQDMTYPKGTKTLWVCGDRHQDELLERAIAFGIPEEAILLNSDSDNPYGGVDLDNPDNIDGLRMRTIEDKPGLIIIDTLWRTTKRKMSKEDEVNSFVGPLLEIAQDTDTTLLAMTHLNLNEETLGRRLDGVARSILKMTQPDPSQLDRRKLEITGNFKEPEPLGMTFKDDGFEYDDDPPPVKEKSKGGRPSSAATKAKSFIAASLETGDNLIARDLFRVGEEKGYAKGDTWWRALDEMKADGTANVTGGSGTGFQVTINRTEKTPTSKHPKPQNPIPPRF